VQRAARLNNSSDSKTLISPAPGGEERRGEERERKRRASTTVRACSYWISDIESVEYSEVRIPLAQRAAA